MNIFKQLLVGCCLGMIIMAAGCGNDSTLTSSSASTNGSASKKLGKLVKGPVNKAKVYDQGVTPEKYLGETDANGNFPLGVGPYRSEGGTYIPLKADGTPGPEITAPPMKAPAGATQVTPLSTLFVAATPAQQAEITKLMTTAGITLDTDLSSKSSSNAGLNTIISLNETVGAALQSAGTTNAAAVTSTMVAAVASLSTKTLDEIKTATPASIASTITSAISANPALAAVAAAINAAAATAAEGASKAPVGALPTSNSGSTGGTK